MPLSPGSTVLRVHHSGQQLDPLAPRCRLFEAKRIPQYAAGSSQVVGAGNPTLPDLVNLFAEGMQVPLKDLPHQLGIPGNLDLGERRVCRGWFSVHKVLCRRSSTTSIARNSCWWASSQRTRATSWAAFLTCPWEVCRSPIIERYFPRALLSGLAASKMGSASISTSSKGLISW